MPNNTAGFHLADDLRSRMCANISLLFKERPLLERFEAAKQAGFDAVEIQFPYEESFAQLVKAKNAAGVEVVLINVPAGDLMTGGEGLAAVPGKQKMFRAALEQCAEYAQALEVSCVNVLPGRCLDASQRPHYQETLHQNLRLAAEKLHPLGITTTFEAINTFDMPGFLIHSTAQMVETLATLQHPGIAMQYDIYHMARMGEDLIEQLQRYTGQIGHIQFADCPGRGQPGSGKLDFTALFNVIALSQYRGWIGAEYNPADKLSTEDSLNWL